MQYSHLVTEVTDSVIIMQSSKSGRGKRKLPTRIVKWNKKDEENKVIVTGIKNTYPNRKEMFYLTTHSTHSYPNIPPNYIYILILDPCVLGRLLSELPWL